MKTLGTALLTALTSLASLTSARADYFQSPTDLGNPIHSERVRSEDFIAALPSIPVVAFPRHVPVMALRDGGALSRALASLDSFIRFQDYANGRPIDREANIGYGTTLTIVRDERELATLRAILARGRNVSIEAFDGVGEETWFDSPSSCAVYANVPVWTIRITGEDGAAIRFYLRRGRTMDGSTATRFFPNLRVTRLRSARECAALEAKVRANPEAMQGL